MASLKANLVLRIASIMFFCLALFGSVQGLKEKVRSVDPFLMESQSIITNLLPKQFRRFILADDRSYQALIFVTMDDPRCEVCYRAENSLVTVARQYYQRVHHRFMNLRFGRLALTEETIHFIEDLNLQNLPEFLLFDMQSKKFKRLSEADHQISDLPNVTTITQPPSDSPLGGGDVVRRSRGKFGSKISEAEYDFDLQHFEEFFAQDPSTLFTAENLAQWINKELSLKIEIKTFDFSIGSLLTYFVYMILITSGISYLYQTFATSELENLPPVLGLKHDVKVILNQLKMCPPSEIVKNSTKVNNKVEKEDEEDEDEDENIKANADEEEGDFPSLSGWRFYFFSSIVASYFLLVGGLYYNLLHPTPFIGMDQNHQPMFLMPSVRSQFGVEVLLVALTGCIATSSIILLNKTMQRKIPTRFIGIAIFALQFFGSAMLLVRLFLGKYSAYLAGTGLHLLLMNFFGNAPMAPSGDEYYVDE